MPLFPDDIRSILFGGCIMPCVGLFLGASLALLGRTSVGLLTVLAAFCAYEYGIGPRVAAGGAAPKPSDIGYTITLGSTNLVGADIWVNDVYLGKIPVQTTIEEFAAKVPYWPTPPEGYEQGRYDVSVPACYSMDGTATNNRLKTLVVFEAPRLDLLHWQSGGYHPGKYYARVEYAGEIGLGDVGGGSTGGSSSYQCRSSSCVNVTFPEREKRLDHLLGQVRLSGYKADPRWLEGIQTYGDDGWLALRQAAEKEPKLFEALDAWAIWHYGLDGVDGPDSAWQAFDRIRAEADRSQCYVTLSAAGRAVELIAKHLDPERLVAEAECILKEAEEYSLVWWNAYGQTHFGIVTRPQGWNTTGGTTHYGKSCGGQPLLPSAAVVAHAIWLSNEYLGAEQEKAPNIAQERLVPKLIRYGYRNDFLGSSSAIELRMATTLGGPHIDRFLLRQNWSDEPSFDKAPEAHAWIDGKTVNGWLYLIAQLRAPGGRMFRVEHGDALLQLAETLCGKSVNSDSLRSIDFVFWDLDRGKESLAYRFWPRYREIARKTSPSALRTQWEYLVHIDPVSTPKMYVECMWENAGLPNILELPCGALDRLPDERRVLVVDALLAEVPRFAGPQGLEGLDRDMIRKLEHAKLPKQYDVQDTLKMLGTGEDDAKRENIAKWLEHTEPTSPVVAVLARHENPRFRSLVFGAIQEHPSPENRDILIALLNDPDESVRAKANETAQALEKLAATDPMTFASDPSAVAGR